MLSEERSDLYWECAAKQGISISAFCYIFKAQSRVLAVNI